MSYFLTEVSKCVAHRLTWQQVALRTQGPTFGETMVKKDGA